MKLTTHLCLVPRSRMTEQCRHSIIRLHGVMINYFVTGAILHFIFTMVARAKLLGRTEVGITSTYGDSVV
jgi:hypothetical protein